MDRRAFLAAAALTGAGRSNLFCQSRSDADFELDEVSLAEISNGLQKGKWTCSRLVELYLGRIEAVDRNGPGLNAVIELNPEAAALARALDRDRKANHLRGPLHGVPILLKDNIETGDRMRTSAGSLALADWRARQDSFVAARLRRAGALILGKTNLSEWANFRSTHSTSGWSARGGQTRNPYALDRNPSGSSSGSAVATAANLCAGAIGTETDGSVTSPSSINGIVGLKPTVGLISRAGIIPISASQDTAGPMARTVRDVAMLLNAMTTSDYTRFLDPRGLRGARLGIVREFFGSNGPLDRFFSECVDALRREGAEVIDPADLTTQDLGAPEMETLLYEFKEGLNRYLSRLPTGAPRSLKQLIAFNEQNRDREMPFFGQELFLQAEEKGPLSKKEYLDARRDCLRLSRKEGIDKTMTKYRLDALVAPTSGPGWMTDTAHGDRDTGGCTTPAAVAGYPHITVPAGFLSGLPIGLSFFGAAWSESTLIKLAYAWEQVTKARRKPALLASARDER